MTLLTMMTELTEDFGITTPTQVIGSTDQQIVQLLAIAQREGVQLGHRYNWSIMTREFTFTQAAAALQGTLAALIGTDYKSIKNDILWNRTTQLPILGPLAPRDWQALQAFPVTGPYPQFRIKEKSIYFSPTPGNATDTIAGEYKSSAFCESSGGTAQARWAADNDIGLLDEDIMKAGIMWRWKQRKGLDYAQDFDDYERMVADAMTRDSGKRQLRLDAGREDRIPGIFVPQGSWSV